MAGWALHLWNEWSIQILVLFSYTLQVVLLFLSRMRRRNISRAPRLLLWLVYLLADSTALYTLGHISTSKSPELRLTAFWAQFLLLHLGGQDSMTAYALEDNQLWLRHLLTLVLQALGAAYLLYRHIAGRGTLLTSAILIHVVGILKYGGRVWTLKSSSLDGITNFLDKVEMSRPPLSNNQVAVGEQEHKVDAEEVLQEAHDLLYICMGQFVDYKVWPSEWQQEAIKPRHKNGGLMELVGMQLSLMHDVFYTKAVVIRTWYGCCNRVVSLVTIVTALWLFRFKTRNASYRTSDVDVAVTYTLLVGAILLEMTSILRAIGSSWTCTFFRTRRWHRLHSAIVFFRQLFKSAEHGRRWQGNAGQYNLLDLCTMKHDLSRRLARNAGLDNWLNKVRSTKNIAFSGENDITQLVLGEMERMVEACQGKEDTMWSYRGQKALSKLDGFKEDRDWCIDTEFDESILAWHFATNVYLTAIMRDFAYEASSQLAVAIKVLSNYMMFLLAEHPYLLPSPVRSRQYVMASKWLLNPDKSGDRLHQIVDRIQKKEYANFEPVLLRGATLATRLLELGCSPDVLRAIFGVWVEKLCYEASHCSRDSHTRQLNSGAEFITVIWILATAGV